MHSWLLRTGTAADAAEITTLVNQAYRGQGGDGSVQGWTNEIGLVEGPRTSVGEVLQQMEAGVFLCARLGGDGPLRGCVWFEPRGREGYIGMLSVFPALQNSGLGRLLMVECEALARERQIPTLVLTVLAPRAELQAWYQRQGYEPTGERLPFPHGGPLELLVFRKLTPAG